MAGTLTTPTRMLVQYGGPGHWVEFKLEDGVVFGRYLDDDLEPTTGWESRRPDGGDPRHERIIGAIDEVLAQYSGVR